jgi:hypothetical protein
MPLIKAYNIDSDLHGLESHSIFKSVYTVEASWKGTFGHLMQTASAESCFSLEDLRRRSIDPTPPPFFGENHCQPGCTHPFSEEASPEFVEASWRNIEL